MGQNNILDNALPGQDSVPQDAGSVRLPARSQCRLSRATPSDNHSKLVFVLEPKTRQDEKHANL